MNKIILLLLLSIVSGLVSAQVPQRKAIMGMLGKETPQGIRVDSIIASSTMAAAGIQKGDVIISLNGSPAKTIPQYSSVASAIRTGDTVKVEYLRGSSTKQVSVKAIMRPYEQSDIADITYDWVKFRNGYLRVVTRKPKEKDHVPAILLIPGYGCGSVENYTNSYNGKLMNAWINNGYAVVTIEKSGLGDSYGCEPCAGVDLATDIESFDAGYRYMEALPFADKGQLYIWGHSMGGTIAPEIAKRHSPKGVMVFACVFRPWSEFLLEMHRVQKPLLENQTYLQTETFMRKIQQIYYEFFVLKKSPAELYGNPAYHDLVASELNYKEGSTNMWGRHWRFWMQLDSLNLAESWQQTNCPVLVIHGGADYEQCSQVEPLMIRETVNAAHPGFATMVTIDNLDHFMMVSKDWKEAVINFRDQQYQKGNFNERIAETTVSWLKQH